MSNTYIFKHIVNDRDSHNNKKCWIIDEHPFRYTPLVRVAFEDGSNGLAYPRELTMCRSNYIIVTGNPVDGFKFVGPFDDKEKAIEVAEHHIIVDWWIADLTSPESY